MVTHQGDWQRMAFMAWALGRFNCDHMIETGCGEGETIGYFSRFLPSMGGGVDLNQGAIEIAHSRYPRVGFAVMDAIEFLQKADPRPGKAFFYLDCTWGSGCPAKDQLPIIFKRWYAPIVFVSGVALTNGSSGVQQLADLIKFGKMMITPNYSMGSDQSGYCLIVPEKVEVNLPNTWDVI